MATNNVATDETHNLISAEKVDGTAVYNPQGDQMGHIKTVMINKRNGRVAYAVMSFGGFLGIGEDYHPLPWDVLTYDTRYGGYVVDLDRNRLANAPRYAAGSEPDWNNREYQDKVRRYYGMPDPVI